MKGRADMKKTWPIEIDCPNCAAKLERALAEMPGVTHVSINYVHKRITQEAADDQFAAMTEAMLAKAAEVEPDAVIHVDGTPAQDESHDHDHHHEHAEHAGRT